MANIMKGLWEDGKNKTVVRGREKIVMGWEVRGRIRKGNNSIGRQEPAQKKRKNERKKEKRMYIVVIEGCSY